MIFVAVDAFERGSCLLFVLLAFVISNFSEELAKTQMVMVT